MNDPCVEHFMRYLEGEKNTSRLEGKGALSDRQMAALKKMVARYRKVDCETAKERKERIT